MGNGKKKANEPFTGLAPSIKASGAATATTVTVEESIVQQFIIPEPNGPTTSDSTLDTSDPLPDLNPNPTFVDQPEPATDQTAAEPAPDEAVPVEPAAEPAVAPAADLQASQDLTGVDALDFQAEHSDDILTPIPTPDQVRVGDGLGDHLILGGDDFKDSQVTLIAYADAKNPDKQRQILFTHVTPEAEEKIRDALALKATMVDKDVTETVNGPVTYDTDNNLAAEMELAARSVNSHLKAGDELPQHTIDRVTQLRQKLDAVNGSTDPAVAAMVEHYRPALEAMETATADFDAAKALYAQDGTRVPKVSAFTTEHEVTKTIKVPGPSTTGLAVTEVNNRVVQASLADGVSSWDGKVTGDGGGGKMLRIDFDDGYVAYYRPREGITGEYSPAEGRVAGQLEIVAPANVNDPTELVNRLSRLNLTNDPLTHRETEWAYLKANVFAGNLEHHPSVKSALTACQSDVAAQVGVLTAQHYSEAIGLSEPELRSWSQRIAVRAQRRSLAKRTERLRAAVADATGTSPDGLINSGHYSPSPILTRVGVTWRRFDVDPEKVTQAWKDNKRGLSHRLVKNPENILNMLQTGTLSSQDRRRRLGVPTGVGWSEGNDKTFEAVFLRNWTRGKVEGNSAGFAWSDPSALMQRPDWWANAGDSYGSASSARDPLTVANSTGGSNEIMFRSGIDLYGPEGPSRVNVPKHLLDDAKKIVADKGITHVNGIPIDTWLRPV